nr:DNA methyltransferase [uncultured Brevundimonas sp.]
MSVTVHHGDSRIVLKTFADASVDSVVCDPPYALVSIGKRFGAAGAAPAQSGKTGAYARASAGFMGQKWDTGETAFDPAFWAEVLRVLKPGGHLIAFSGTRTYHRLACAVEDAGFEIRDMVSWLYGSGFPKSHSVSKAIDRHNGDERPVIGTETIANDMRGGALLDVAHGVDRPSFQRDVTSAASAASAAWEGWGTALKPACEPIVLARKPLVGTVAANVLAHGTGALNIDRARVGWPDGVAPEIGTPGWGGPAKKLTAVPGQEGETVERAGPNAAGRWPANVIHDGSDEVVEAFPAETGGGDKRGRGQGTRPGGFGDVGSENGSGEPCGTLYADSGSAARFFYSAKADAADRCGSKHPTVKPIDLMAYLCRLVTPKGGTVLDPFAGSGSTGMACLREGFDCVLIEREAEYVADIHRRLQHVEGADTPLFAQAVVGEAAA